MLLDDDFLTSRRLGPQERFYARPEYCRTGYGAEGLFVEAVNESAPCEYVLYTFQAPVAAFSVIAEVRLDRHPQAAKAYGIRLTEWQPADPDSPLAYRGTVWGVDNFSVRSSNGTVEDQLFFDKIEDIANTNERQQNIFRADVSGRSMTWSLNGRKISTVPTRTNLSGQVTTYLEGRGLRVIIEHLKVTAGASQ